MNNTDKKITRRKAIEKTGKYAALTAAATFLILSPKKSQADSPTDPGWAEASPFYNSKPRRKCEQQSIVYRFR